MHTARHTAYWTALLAGSLAALLSGQAPRAAEPEVRFNRDVLPILADHCFACHGPDKNQRQGDLRLDVREDALAPRNGPSAIVPGKPHESELLRRVVLDDDERMPPPKAGKKLTPHQVEVLRRWIAAGAPWERHWALIPPQAPPRPHVKDKLWPRQTIDLHVLAKLERQDLAPAAEADRATLLRRVTLDLTGLPPTPEETQAFLNDRSPDAYERVVERLLASPRLGERLAFRWLDAARYADSNGYQTDGERIMWRWRDWVIEAFNDNMPFDQFTIEQLAGDLLPEATLEQRLATGFNRNHRGNAEGGIIPEEFAVEYVADRVETTATVWLGLTLACTRCHDHKYDPFSQREFYQLYAFFNSIPEKGRAVKYGNSPPYIATPTRAQQAQLAALEEQIAAAEQACRRQEGELAAAQAAWERSLAAGPTRHWNPRRALALEAAFEGDLAAQTDGPQQACEGRAQGEGAYFADGAQGRALRLAGKGHVQLDGGAFGFYDKFTLSAWVYCDDAAQGTVLSKMVDLPRAEGYALQVAGGKLQLNLVKRWLDDALRVETAAACIQRGRWHHVAATYDGSRVAEGVRLYVDGKLQPLSVLLDELNQDFAAKEPLRIGWGGGAESGFSGRIDEVRLYRRALLEDEVAWLALREPLTELAALPVSKRTSVQAEKLRACFIEEHAPPAIRASHQRLRELRENRQRLVESFPTTMVMQELPEPRAAHVLIRGVYDKPGEIVSRDTPAALHRFASDLPRNRLGLARWLVHRENPLTARVTVNRVWQMLFGVGLVKTTEDFGTQGERPVNQELLDQLAVDFMNSAWDLKGLLRTIVTSSTYRQSSRTSPLLARLDPENRLLARGPRARLPAEMIRDQALFAAGLLVEHVGGPSVNPYQPPGLWEEVSGSAYQQDHGEKLYRRSLYTFWKRTIAPPSMLTFDASGREFCVVRETRTNTPLQALALLNEVTYVEAARLLAERVLREAQDDDQRLQLAWKLVLSRSPSQRELGVLREALARHRARYRADPAAAAAVLTVGEHPADQSLDTCETAAMSAVASLILNLDEAITKE